MITAYKEGTRDLIFPTRGIKGICPYCEKPLITKCGPFKLHHFAHKRGADCASNKYHDGMSEWHIKWQLTINDPIPGVNVEVPLNNEEYQKRADLVTPVGVIIEFQKSPLPIEERLLREKHYKNMLWVVHQDRFKSQTWGDEFGDKPVFIDFTDTLYCKNENFSIKKDKFIRSIINNRFFDEHTWNIIKERALRHGYKDLFEKYSHLILFHDEDIISKAIDCDLTELFRLETERKKRYYEQSHASREVKKFQCPKCNLWYYSFDAFENHKKMCC